ncbi:hypothetical protein DBV15_09572 [Temnothorax longispinosus]|uniref:Uncharacterized protein n=1 Tax=Temnothorax longispinosus TaxID=300112 RepID=A0A4S2KAJ8_9HYME|nr:hypothetical protein DBV15_09572 [Temnothorax longispinosus]
MPVRIVGALLQRVEHVGARGALVRECPITVVLEEVAAVEYRQGDRHVEFRPRGHVAEYVSVRILLPMAVGLLEAELDEEPEELARVERAGDVRGAGVLRAQRQAEQRGAEDAHQPPTGGGPILNRSSLGTFPTNSAGQLDVLGHDGNPLGVNRAKVGVLEQADEVGLARLLQSHNGRALEAEVGLEVLSDFTNQPLERELADQKLGALLVATDLTKSDGSRTITMRLLDTTGCGRAFTGCLRRQLLTRGLASGRFASGLLGSCHLERIQMLSVRYDDLWRYGRSAFCPKLPRLYSVAGPARETLIG